MKDRARLILFPVGMAGILLLILLADRRPGYFANSSYMGALVALQIVLVALSHYESVFLPLLLGTFLWAGSDLPFYAIPTSLRWLFLGVGALAGFVIWIKTPRARHFQAFHLIALFCVLSALVSGLVSEVPGIALLKVTSLFMLFLYASGGARAAIVGREPKFINGLVLCCEALAYVSATCYFVLGFSLFGNPNALGAIIGVVAFPVLLWAGLVADTRGLRQRRLFALVLCGALLYRSNSRASILGAATVVLLFTIALRYKRLMLQFAFVTVFFVTLMAVINPSRIDELASSFFGRVIYKEQTGAHAAGVFGSRLSPWSETILVIRRRPWFGSGFGTSDLGESRRDANVSSVYTTQGTNREHGNSYLALAEYLGLLGLVPFLLLLVMVLRSLIRILYWMRKTGNAYHYCIPFALVVIAGLVHACFEDWLFAVGSYLCVFFWISAFVLLDLMPAAAPFRSSVAYQPRPDPLATSASAAIAHSLH